MGGFGSVQNVFDIVLFVVCFGEGMVVFVVVVVGFFEDCCMFYCFFVGVEWNMVIVLVFVGICVVVIFCVGDDGFGCFLMVELCVYGVDDIVVEIDVDVFIGLYVKEFMVLLDGIVGGIMYYYCVGLVVVVLFLQMFMVLVVVVFFVDVVFVYIFGIMFVLLFLVFVVQELLYVEIDFDWLFSFDVNWCFVFWWGCEEEGCWIVLDFVWCVDIVFCICFDVEVVFGISDFWELCVFFLQLCYLLVIDVCGVVVFDGVEMVESDVIDILVVEIIGVGDVFVVGFLVGVFVGFLLIGSFVCGYCIVIRVLVSM